MGQTWNYRIGLDIGIASVGWAVLQNNSKDEPVHIIDMGVRTFTKAETPKTGESLAAPRRDARTTRRRLRRRKHRLDRIKYLLQQEGMIDIEAFMKRYQSPNLPDVYTLRYEALERKLSNDEFAQVLIHIAKHRGFKSTRKADAKEDKENGKVLAATNENKAIMDESGYRTVGEMIFRDEKFHTECPWSEKGYLVTPRNKSEDYRHTILRAMLVDEVKTIFEMQRSFHNTYASQQLENAYLDIMQSQRSFDMGPGKQTNGKPSPYAMEGFEDRVGNCTFEKTEKRAAKATYTAELFVALQKISHTKLIDMAGESRNFTKEERNVLISLLHEQKEIKYAAVRKKLAIADDLRFKNLNYKYKKKNETEADLVKDTEKAVFISMPWFYEYKKALALHELHPYTNQSDEELLNRIGTILTCYKNDDSRIKRLSELSLDASEIDKLLELTPSKFQHISIKAMQKINPYLKEGMTYDKACTKAQYDFRANSDEKKQKLLKGEDINRIVNDITNPVVKRSISQTIKVINAIIMKYGSPQAVNIELAREMSKNFQERTKIKNDMESRQKDNEKVKKEIQELGVLNPTGQDILKYRLWQEQDGRCLYSGEVIPLEQLFVPGYDIDHILPYSITFDDSFRNKVLVTSKENRQKGNRTPYEYFGNDQERWHEFEVRVKTTIRDYKKQQKLLKEHFTDEERDDFKERNLTDTKYITKEIYNMIRQYLELAPFNDPKKKKQVYAVNGTVTAYLRKRWGLMKKDRKTDTHHAMDAVVIACCTDGMIHKISRYMQGRELQYAKGFQLVDEETGEIFERDNFSKEQWDKTFGVQIPEPWQNFKTELEVRMGTDPLNFLETHRDVNVLLDYPEEIYQNIRPIFVSRMPNHKVTGAAHKDTIRSPREYQTNGIVITKTALQDLKLTKDNEISGYYNKESDWLLYQALREQLLKYQGDAKKAFAEPFYKPKADGTKGHLVRKVKICDKQTSGVLVNGGKGIAANGSMVRIDVFCENGKYYYVPIYTADVVKKVLPNRAAKAYKSYEEWKIVEDKDLVFSLYPQDLIHIVSDKGLKLKDVHGGQFVQKDVFAYFSSANIATASIAGIAHDSNFSFEGLGIQKLLQFEKCQVDILGNVSYVRKEQRMGFQNS